jgi:hypothetical protein
LLLSPFVRMHWSAILLFVSKPPSLRHTRSSFNQNFQNPVPNACHPLQQKEMAP